MTEAVRILSFAGYGAVAYGALYAISGRGAAATLAAALVAAAGFGALVGLVAQLPPYAAIAFAGVTAIYLWLLTLLVSRARRAVKRRSGGRPSAAAAGTAGLRLR